MKRENSSWVGTERIMSGKCKVNWVRSARPRKGGGLGILHLAKFARALHLRWLWHDWMNEGPLSDQRDIPCSQVDHKLFAAATTITIGDGKKASFWHSSWAQGQTPRDMAPNLFNISRTKNRTLHDAMIDDVWIRDLNLLHRGFSVTHFVE